LSTGYDIFMEVRHDNCRHHNLKMIFISLLKVARNIIHDYHRLRKLNFIMCDNLEWKSRDSLKYADVLEKCNAPHVIMADLVRYYLQ